MPHVISGPDIVTNLRSINSSSFTSDVERRQALQEAHALISRLETPLETSARLNVGYPATLVCVKTALDLKLFESWLSKYDGRPCSVTELQELVPHCNSTLFMRVLRHLVSSNVLWTQSQDSGPLLYEMTPYIIGQVKDDFASQLECTFHWAMSMMISLPDFLAKIQYANPQTAALNPVKEYTDGLSIWQYLQSNEGWAQIFGRLMRASSKMRGNVMELFEDQRLDDQDSNTVLLVDIGGNQGHDLIAFRETFPEAQGRLILQDLPHVIQSAPQLGKWRIDKMSYDFFTPQPIKRAKAYLLHNIIHDWPDDEAKRILENVVLAMDRNVSRLFIVDMVIREESPALNETGMDWLMMIYGNGMERTEHHWNELLGSAGLRIKRIKRSKTEAGCLIEAEKI